MSEIKLKTCPFCNGNTNIRENYDIIDWVNDEPVEELRYVVECDNEECLCYANTKMYDTKEKAIIAWNTRKPVEKTVERLEKIKSKLCQRASNKTNVNKEGLDRIMKHVIRIVKGGGAGEID